MCKKNLYLLISAFSFIMIIGGFNFIKITNPYDFHEKYSLVRINISSPNDIQRLVNNDINIDHYHGDIKNEIEVVINSAEVQRLGITGVSYDILIDDIEEYHREISEPEFRELHSSKHMMESDNITGFSYGSMGGFQTYAEVVQKLDSMRLQYPNLITQKINLGTSHESRVIWGVKISDNPDQDESSTEPAVYYDALHHSREPISMSVLLYYMYWLLENYNTNPIARYLVDNREIFFVPVVNPDGYEYNRSTNPNGGGMWRKNRRNNGGSYGVDLNRNYPYGWGYESGSSGVPSSETYRGPSAASEPETQAIINFLTPIKPKIAFSTHSVAGRYLNPYGYNDSTVAFDVYSEYSGDFAAVNDYLYGTVKEMLNYYSSGTTRDYLHSQGTYCWTPEIGGTGFWPPQSQIIPLCNENLIPLQYLTWVSGPYIKLQDYNIEGNGHIISGNTVNLNLRVRNKGLSKIPQGGSYAVSIRALNSGVIPNVNTITFDNDTLSPRSNRSLQQQVTLPSDLTYLSELKFEITTSQKEFHNPVITGVDTISFTVGQSRLLFRDNADSTGINRWTRSGSGMLWDTTFVGYWDGLHSFTDSRYGNSADFTNNYFTLNDTIDLTGAVNPRLEFNTKWAIEKNYDYSRLQISTNFGSSWVNTAGKYTTTVGGQPSYTGISSWVKEIINLNSYIGKKLKIRFQYYTDGGIPGDGFYFDNFKVIDYRDTLMSITPVSSFIPERYSLHQNFPNPFNPSTKIHFDLPENIFVSIKIHDVLGREVASLVNDFISAGRYEIDFDASGLSSGVYFYSLQTTNFREIKKMTLLR